MEPGNYSLRFGVVDSSGRRGSVIREVNAWKLGGEEFALGDLLIGDAATDAAGRIRPGVEPRVRSDLGALLELYSTSSGVLDGVKVNVEIADDQDSPALLTTPAEVIAGDEPTQRTVQGVLSAALLPAGRYVARARVLLRDGNVAGVLVRPFILDAPEVTSAGAPSPFMWGTVAKFDPRVAMTSQMVRNLLNSVETRFPDMKGPLVEARAGRYGIAAIEALTAGDQAAAAFFKGLDWYAKGQLGQAATQLELAAGPRRDFFAAAFYLGAVFAAAGRDRDAAGVWQMAIGNEPRPLLAYTLLADARLRAGQPASAIDVLKPAYERTPGDEEIGERLMSAYLIMGRYEEALPVLDGYLSRHPTDEVALFAAVFRAVPGRDARAPRAANRRRGQARPICKSVRRALRGAADEVPPGHARQVSWRRSNYSITPADYLALVSFALRLSYGNVVARRCLFMRRVALVLSTAVLAAALAAAQGPGGGRGRGIPIQPGEECPPGTTLVRVGRCQAPESPPPSIVDYRPRSALVAEEHSVPKAKFPVVDIHSHTGPTPQTIDQLVQEMDAMNIRVLNNLSGGFGSALKRRVDYIRGTKYADRFTVFTNGLDGFGDVEAGYGRRAAAQLEEDVRHGAIGFKIFKQTGMDTLKKDGTRLKINDPELAPIWETAARLNIPVIIHTAEPQEFFHQPDMHNERWLELALFPNRRQYLNKITFEELVAERNELSGRIQRRASFPRTSGGMRTTLVSPPGRSTPVRT